MTLSGDSKLKVEMPGMEDNQQSVANDQRVSSSLHLLSVVLHMLT